MTEPPTVARCLGLIGAQRTHTCTHTHTLTHTHTYKHSCTLHTHTHTHAHTPTNTHTHTPTNTHTHTLRYVSRLKLIAEDFYDVVKQFSEKSKDAEVMQIFLNIQQIHQLNQTILQSLETRIDSW